MSALTAAEPIARTAATAIVNALWEDAAIFIAVALVLRLWPRLNASTRYAAWMLALVAAIATPIFTAFPRAGAVPVPGVVVFAIGTLWLLAAFAFSIRLLVGLVRLQRLKSSALPLRLEHRGSEQDALLAGNRDVRFCVSDETSVPVAVGLFDSMVLVPRHLFESLAPEEIEQICLHEMAHLRRADDWTNLLQRILSALAWFSPAVYAIARGLDLEREVACDDDVIARTHAVRPYAQCLTKMAEITAWPHEALAAPGVFVTRRGISERVERLLRAGRNAARELALAPTALAVGVLAFAGFGMRLVAPTAAAPLPAVRQQVAVARTAPPAPAVRPRTEVRVEREYVRVPATRVRVERVYVHVPATHVRVPATHVRVPAVSVDVPPVNVSVPGIDVHVPGIDVHVPAIDVPYGSMDARGCMGCDFSNSNLSGKDFHGQTFVGADFEDARLQNADFARTHMTGVDFERADLHGADFRGAHLRGVDFESARLSGARFAGATLVGCELSGVDLSHVDLSGARIVDGDR
ncbi:MAG: M56 family metallopeptidase [Candidatus Tyrphobacter sp.]